MGKVTSLELQKTFGGKGYQLYRYYDTKNKADKTALAFRSIGIPARVIKKSNWEAPGVYSGNKWGWPWLVYFWPDKNIQEIGLDQYLNRPDNIQFWQIKAAMQIEG